MAEEKTRVSEARKRANRKYRREKEKLFSFRLSINTNPRMIEYLNGSDNRQRLIKSAIADKMRKEGIPTDE